MINRNSNNFADLSNGTAQTIVDLYPKWQVSEFDLQSIADKTGLQEVLDLCVDYYETDKYVFVHGWIPTVPYCLEYDADWRNVSKNRWEIAIWATPVEMYSYKMFEPNKTTVCEYWHCSAFWHMFDKFKYEEFGEKANFQPFITKEVSALDACSAYSNKANVVVLDD